MCACVRACVCVLFFVLVFELRITSDRVPTWSACCTHAWAGVLFSQRRRSYIAQGELELELAEGSEPRSSFVGSTFLGGRIPHFPCRPVPSPAPRRRTLCPGSLCARPQWSAPGPSPQRTRAQSSSCLRRHAAAGGHLASRLGLISSRLRRRPPSRLRRRLAALRGRTTPTSAATRRTSTRCIATAGAKQLAGGGSAWPQSSWHAAAGTPRRSQARPRRPSRICCKPGRRRAARGEELLVKKPPSEWPRAWPAFVLHGPRSLYSCAGAWQ